MKHQSVPGGKKLVVRESDSPRPELQSAKTGSLSRSITLASSSMSSVVQRRELDRKRRDMLSAAPLEHAVVQRADDRVMKNVPVPEPHRLATNALFGDDGKPVLPLLRTHFSHEGLLFWNNMDRSHILSIPLFWFWRGVVDRLFQCRFYFPLFPVVFLLNR